jgi:hypothetical protein
MKTSVVSTLIVGLLASAAAFAAAPTGAPAGTMGMCNDGSYSTNAEKKGACRGHKGVKDWYGDEASIAAPGGPRATSTSTTMTPPAANTTMSTKPTSPAVAGRTSGEPTAPAAGGGPGKVWANTSTKVYHCSGDKYYGTTKHGEYMTETDAKGKGYHADHGKACG